LLNFARKCLRLIALAEIFPNGFVFFAIYKLFEIRYVVRFNIKNAYSLHFDFYTKWVFQVGEGRNFRIALPAVGHGRGMHDQAKRMSHGLWNDARLRFW